MAADILKELLDSDQLMERVMKEKYCATSSTIINEEIDHILILLASNKGNKDFKRILQKKATILANMWLRRMK